MPNGLPGVVIGLTLLGAAASSAQGTALPPQPPTETHFFPLAEVKAGQHGVAYTVFQGVLPEPMDVEILGILKNSQGPGRDLILARLHGSKPEYTGVVAGMSGSPVYIDGRLAGALSYRIGQFSKEPIAGITPIAEMLEVRDTPHVPAPRPGDREIQPIETPLIFSGYSQEALDRFGDRFRALGLTPVAGLGGQDSGNPQPEPLIPGSAVSAILVRGDLSMAGTCTVTYLDAARLLACGHPITQNGPVSMPMTKATVIATLASPLNAFKIVNTTQTVGSFTQDRAAAVSGQFGVTARMIPVQVELTGTAQSKTFHFEVLDDRQLTPSAMLVSIYQSLQSTNNAAAEQSYRLSGELRVMGQPPVKLAGIMAPGGSNSGAITAALYVGERFNRVYENVLQQPRVTGLRLNVQTEPNRLTAQIESARLSRLEVRPGEALEVEVTLRPYQAEPRVLRLPIVLPSTLSPGPLRLLISDGAALDRLTSSPAASAHPLSLTETVFALNRAHPNDRIYVTLLEHTAQAVLPSGTIETIPLSMANVLSPLKDNQELQLTGESAAELASQPTGEAVTGSQVLRLLIR